MKSPANRLKEFVAYQAIKVSRFEKEIGAGNATIKKIIEENREISSDIVNKVLKRYPELNRNWLLFEEGEMLLDHNLKKSKIEDPTLTRDYLLQENIKLYRKLREYEDKDSLDLDKITELKKKIDELTELLNKKIG